MTWKSKSRTGWAVSNATYRCLTCPPMRNNGHWQTKQSGERFRRVEEAVDQYIRRWFVKEKENVAKRRAPEVQNAQQLWTPLGSRLGGGGRKRSGV